MTATLVKANQHDVLASRRKFRALYLLLWILPFMGILAFIARYGVDVPYWDEYESDIAGFLVRAASGHGITWAGLMAQHNENRIFFPRLVALVPALFAAWDVRWEMVASALLVLITSAALFCIALRTIKNRNAAWATALLVDWLLFTPGQWQNFLWGLQVTVFMPTVALAIIMLTLGSDLNIWAATLIAAAAAIFSTFSFAPGMLVWMLAIPFFLMHSSRQRMAALGIWLALAAIAIGYYFHGYIKPELNPPMTLALHEPVLAVQFLLAFLGNALRIGDDLTHDIVLGLLVCFVWIIAVSIVVIRRNRDLLRRSLPWIVFGSYAILSGMSATAGRLGWGLVAANPDRYTSSALPLWISLVPLWVLISQDRKPIDNRKWGIPAPIWAMAIAIAFGALAGAYFIKGELGAWVADRLAARAVVQFSSTAPQGDAIYALVYPDPVKVLAMIADLDSAHLLHCGRLASNNVADLPGGEGSDYSGVFEFLKKSDDKILAIGWAFNPEQNTRADAILLTVPGQNGTDRVIAIVTDDRLHRGDVVKATHHRWLMYCGWIYTFDAGRLPPGSVVSAWAYDSLHERAYRLSQTHVIPK